MNKHLDPAVIVQAARFLKIVGHPLRLKLVERLERGAARVTDLVEASGGASQAEVSKQLAVLRRAGVVRSEPRGNERWYRTADPRVGMILGCIRKHGRSGGGR